uniref:tRNA wybutosine-synthesizing protein 3 homolog n=1 Tax=Anas platyrhynchos TaxID=8839 RepID=A0A8B9R5H0_ANAPL
MAAFGRWKAQRLARADASRKGALDERAAPVVRLLNARARFCTTSSCAGRLVLEDAERRGAPKKGCEWLLVTHEPCRRDELMTALEKATGDVVFKFEPFVLHVLCRELQDAQLLHSVAIDSGFKNSGITVGRGGKIMMAVRSTHCLEVPLSHMGKLMVSEEYIEFLIHVANRKMEENTKRIDRFTRNRISRRAKEHEDQKAEETPICTKTNLFLYVHMIISAIIHQICDLITFMFSVRLIGS